MQKIIYFWKNKTEYNLTLIIWYLSKTHIRSKNDIQEVIKQMCLHFFCRTSHNDICVCKLMSDVCVCLNDTCS